MAPNANHASDSTCPSWPYAAMGVAAAIAVGSLITVIILSLKLRQLRRTNIAAFKPVLYGPQHRSTNVLLPREDTMTSRSNVLLTPSQEKSFTSNRPKSPLANPYGSPAEIYYKYKMMSPPARRPTFSRKSFFHRTPRTSTVVDSTPVPPEIVTDNCDKASEHTHVNEDDKNCHDGQKRLSTDTVDTTLSGLTATSITSKFTSRSRRSFIKQFPPVPKLPDHRNSLTHLNGHSVLNMLDDEEDDMRSVLEVDIDPIIESWQHASPNSRKVIDASAFPDYPFLNQVPDEQYPQSSRASTKSISSHRRRRTLPSMPISPFSEHSSSNGLGTRTPKDGSWSPRSRSTVRTGNSAAPIYFLPADDEDDTASTWTS